MGRVILLMVAFFTMHSPSAGSADENTQREFDRWARMQVERFDGFFNHRKMREAQDQVRRRGAKDQSEARQKLIEDYEKSRRKYVQERTAKPDTTEAEIAWLREQEEKARRYLATQKRYAEKRDELRKLQAKEGKEIPPSLELDLPISEPISGPISGP